MKSMPVFVFAGLLLIVPIDFARADSFFPGEILATSGIATQTSGTNCCRIENFIGLFTLGSMVPATTDWTVTAFNIDTNGLGCKLGQTACSTLVWTFSLELDASNDTVFGTASAPFTGSGGDSRKLTFTYIDGNSSTDPYTNADLTDPTNSRAGTFSYAVAPVPEPSSWIFLGTCLLGLARLAFRKIAS